MKCSTCSNFNWQICNLDIDPSELERLKRLYKGENKKRQSLKEGSFCTLNIVLVKEKLFRGTLMIHSRNSKLLVLSLRWKAKGSLNSESKVFLFGSNLQKKVPNHSPDNYSVHLKRRCSQEWFSTFFWRFQLKWKTFWD